MDKTTICPSSIQGTITAPSSKSDMLRAVAAAYLTGGQCEILRPSYCEDALAALRIVESSGVQIEKTEDRVRFTPTGNTGETVLDCGESGLCIRMFPSIVALSEKPKTLVGYGSLTSRPLWMLEQPLHDLGVECHTKDGLLPVTVKGPLKAGKTTVDASTTSQFLTGLLMALPLCEGTSEIVVPDLKSKPYIEMTLNVLAAFGVKIEHERLQRFVIHGPQKYTAINYQVEGDWSGASCPLVAGAIAGDVRVENLRHHSFQADVAILEALRLSGAALEIGDDYVEVSKQPLIGFEFDATDCPDLFPALVALAAYCQGKSIIHGAQRLSVKESDRGTALLTEFRKMGASIALFPDRIEIIGGTPLDGGTVESHNDHRIAMACAVAGFGSKHGVAIRSSACVAKSYPNFFEDLNGLTTTV
ncbi:3-phosphoshikimate 1-carboxyvinyltransferase [candidate division KSB3 bacterium]|uniref:3-phosphoshikimate 1-carboxyvinyltransferase n=1 Tax=candidate division KSB3 bacterium TaxID=2044937 RepID=A0A2G6KHX5_9BACT|nr:MAG: 3-phosphoshikimate 1-carboxyvinyltransferase [candidate division KSB3 bacterium]